MARRPDGTKRRITGCGIRWRSLGRLRFILATRASIANLACVQWRQTGWEDAEIAEIVTIETSGLGDRTYLAHDGDAAIVIDPQRDFDRVLDAARALGVHITHVLETHIHNDYVTGGLALARATGAVYVVPAGDAVEFERTAVNDGDRIGSGRLMVTAMHTPGHTPHHFSYVLAGAGGDPDAVFTGGSMLFGAVGRTDLIGSDRTDELTRAQYRSVHRLADELSDRVGVHPTHGFGSFCSATATTGDSSTIGNERTHNVALTSPDEDTFVRQLMAGLGAYPRYYAHMGPANSRGPTAPNLEPPHVADTAELRRRIDAGEWVVDLRQRRAFAGSHVEGTISVELGSSFVTFLGWTIPWGTPLTLIGDRAAQVADAQRQLVRIGIDRLESAATGRIEHLAAGRTATYSISDFRGLGQCWGAGDVLVLDVRRPDEWKTGHLDGALHVPLWELEDRMADLPDDMQIWVHCASGFRASIGASLVDRAGRRVVQIDDDWPPAGDIGLPIDVGASAPLGR